MQVTHNLRRHAPALARHAQLVGLMLLGCVSVAMAADKVAELSDDFLEYLGSLESDDETWADFATTATTTEPAVKPSAGTHQDAKVVASVSNSSVSSLALPPAHAVSANPSMSPGMNQSTNKSAASKTTGKADK